MGRVLASEGRAGQLAWAELEALVLEVALETGLVQVGEVVG
jgi:hypothetical protein